MKRCCKYTTNETLLQIESSYNFLEFIQKIQKPYILVRICTANIKVIVANLAIF